MDVKGIFNNIILNDDQKTISALVQLLDCIYIRRSQPQENFVGRDEILTNEHMKTVCGAKKVDQHPKQ